jgi:Ni/Fe-hydrogenase subunit HybB-like protein
MGGIILNRTNVYLVGYRPPFTDHVYFPSVTEWAVTIGSVAAMIFIWRTAAILLPIVSHSREPEAELA